MEQKMNEVRTVIKEVKPEYLDHEGYDDVYEYRKESSDPFAPVERKYFRVTKQYEDMGS